MMDTDNENGCYFYIKILKKKKKIEKCTILILKVQTF